MKKAKALKRMKKDKVLVEQVFMDATVESLPVLLEHARDTLILLNDNITDTALGPMGRQLYLIGIAHLEQAHRMASLALQASYGSSPLHMGG